MTFLDDIALKSFNFQENCIPSIEVSIHCSEYAPKSNDAHRISIRNVYVGACEISHTINMHIYVCVCAIRQKLSNIYLEFLCVPQWVSTSAVIVFALFEQSYIDTNFIKKKYALFEMQYIITLH